MIQLVLVSVLFYLTKADSVEYKYKSPKSCEHLTVPTATAYKSLTVGWMLDCVRQCSHDSSCLSATFDGSQTCYIFSDDQLNCTVTQGSGGMFMIKLKAISSTTMTISQTTTEHASTTEVAPSTEVAPTTRVAPTTEVSSTTEIATTTGETTTMETIITTEEMIETTPLTCLNSGTLDSATQTCKCINGFVGDTCERIMMDCTEGFKSGHYNEEGYVNYFIKPTLAPTAFKIHCNMKNGGGGSTLMKNSEWWPFVNRNLIWNSYKDGFGSPADNHWLGLDKLHYITTSRPHHLFVEIISEGNTRWRKYENFKVEDETTNHRMTYSGSFPWTQTEASADPDWSAAIESTPLGDSMVGLNGSAFSTFDRDNDLDVGRNCAQEYQGGWWYNACADCNPNGPITKPRNLGAVDEAFWKYDFNDNKISFFQMILRAV